MRQTPQQLIYFAGYNTAKYGPDCTCLFADEPEKSIWWKGYCDGLGVDGRSVRAFRWTENARNSGTRRSSI